MKKRSLFYIAVLTMLASCGNKGYGDEALGPVLLSDPRNEASCVFLTQDEKNNPLVSWAETDSAGNKQFYFANWDAASRKFAAGIGIPIEPNTSIHEEGMPKITVKEDGTMVAIYETSVPSEKSRFGLSDIQYIMSFDKGKTWTPHRSIQSGNAQPGSRSFSSILRLDDGEIGVSWLDTDPDNTHIGRPVMFAKTEGKEGFGNAVLIEPFACQCCRTALSSDGQGNVQVVFRDLLSGSVRDISVSSSGDNGRTFSKAVPFSNDHWVIDGCPHNGPSVVSKNEKTYVTWFTGSEQNGVFYAALDKDNNMLLKRQLSPDGRFVQLCLMPDGTRIAAYNASYHQGDSVYYKIIVTRIEGEEFFEKEISLPRVHASHPVLQAEGQQHVIVGWTENNKVYYRRVDTDSITDRARAEMAPAFSVNAHLKFPELSLSEDPVCGMKINERMTGDTMVFHGKLIGFCSPGCREMFLKDPEAFAIKK